VTHRGLLGSVALLDLALLLLLLLRYWQRRHLA